MKPACALVATCLLGACSYTHDCEIDARNVTDERIAMEVRHVAPSGDARVVFYAEISPDTSTYYLYRARERRRIAMCEAVFSQADDDDVDATTLTVEHGEPAIVDVDAQDGRLVVTERRPE